MNNPLNYKIAFIIPYFGKFPEYFKFWLKTAGWNQNIDFLIFTDDQRIFDYPSNVKVHYMSFAEMKDYIQKKFPFKISLEHPYKLCDFRLAYGFIFEDFLKTYDFWGHCDLDVVWGDVRHFLTDDVLNNYDKILEHGHCELYRNTENINKRFMKDNHPFISYKEVFSTNASFCFDEKTSPINRNLWKDVKCYSNNKIVVNTSFDNFSGFFKDFNSKKIGHLCWEQGVLSYRSKEYDIQDIMYAHFQYRTPPIYVDEKSDKFLLTPEGFVSKLDKRKSCRGFLFGYNIKAKKNTLRFFLYKILFALKLKNRFKKVFIIPSYFTYKEHWKGKIVK